MKKGLIFKKPKTRGQDYLMSWGSGTEREEVIDEYSVSSIFQHK